MYIHVHVNVPGTFFPRQVNGYLDGKGIATIHSLTVSNNEGSIVHLPNLCYGIFPCDVWSVPVGHQGPNFALCVETRVVVYNRVLTVGGSVGNYNVQEQAPSF